MTEREIKARAAAYLFNAEGMLLHDIAREIGVEEHDVEDLIKEGMALHCWEVYREQQARIRIAVCGRVAGDFTFKDAP